MISSGLLCVCARWRTFLSSESLESTQQILSLSEYVPAENILTDKASGKDLNRPAYQALKSALGFRSGDTLYICSLDRLSRNKADIKQELEWYRDNGIRLKVMDLPTSMIEVGKGQEWIPEMVTNILVEVLSSIVEQERQTIRKRQRRSGRIPVDLRKMERRQIYGKICHAASWHFQQLLPHHEVVRKGTDERNCNVTKGRRY